MFRCLNRQVSEVGVLLEEQGQAKTAVYRDELTKKQAPIRKAIVKKSVRFADSEPTILGDKSDELEKEKKESDGEKRRIISSEKREEGMRVKVRMTKEEAARLLSKCKEGGFLEFRDVAQELVKIPVGRVCVIPTSLKKIEEEPTLDKEKAE